MMSDATTPTEKQEALDALRVLIGTGLLIVVLMTVPAAVWPEGFWLGVIWILAAAMALDAVLLFVWGLVFREALSSYWAAAGWMTLWFVEMGVLALAASPRIRSFTLVRFTCFLTGFYLQTRGIAQMARPRESRRKYGMIDLLFGVAAISVALLSEK